ncbi:unnamed protein product [Spirodela intermedia]|uniref:Sugar phosphate transporter domain-containing protein n=1 Tax=Spirodela intermedia TaxID=51605 RepID=A0A7I8ITE0_SPIIN|nr:unnamed protein product [Spirodela intermedia]CAA6661144.1 unnamed protein product [Spirodela intermedia]
MAEIRYREPETGGGEEADRSSLSAPAASFGEVPLLEEEDAPPVTVRQRSMHLNASFSITGIGGGNPKGYTALALAVDGGGAAAGMSHSDSRAKLEADSELGKAAVLKTTFYILVWYTFSTCLTLYNKTLLGDDLGKFPAPLLMNTVHFSLQAVLSNIVVWRQESKATMSWRDYLIRVVPTAVGTALDINLSNVSLVFISVTFATMCKSSSPIFLLVFAFAFRLESPSIKLLGIILIISLGVLLTVAKETEFEFWGFVLVMLASVTSGFRWSMTQILLQKEAYGLKNPLTLMSYVAPVMAIVTAGLSLVMDPWKEFHSNAYFNNTWHTMRSLLLMLIGGMLAFFMVLTEYVLVSATSAVTVMIAGVVKEAVTILVAVLYFHDEFSLLKGIGLMVIMIGVGLFNIYKYQKQQKGLGNNSEEEAPSIPNGAAKYIIFDEIDSEEEGI